MAEISRIKLPSGNYYDLKDAEARRMIAGGISYIIAWNGSSTPVVADIPAGVVVTYNGTNYTGTLAASADTVGKFYLVKSTTQVETLDVYDEYATMQPTSNTYAWEKIGDTSLDLSSLKALAYKDNVTLYKGAGDNVLGENTTFTAGSSSVSFAAHTTKKAIGSSATFTVTQPTVTVTPATTNIKATASGAAVTPTIVPLTYVNSSLGGNLVTTTVPNVTSAGSASTWRFVMGSGDDAETLIIGGDNSVAPTLGSPKTVATGSVAQDGTGSNVVTAVLSGNQDVVTGIASVTQPTIALATGATAGTGVISVATGIDSASASGGAVAFNSKDEVTAITGLGAATAAAQTITVGTNDKVKVAKYDDIAAGDGMVVSGSEPPQGYIKRDPNGSGGTITVNGNAVGDNWSSFAWGGNATVELSGKNFTSSGTVIYVLVGSSQSEAESWANQGFYSHGKEIDSNTINATATFTDNKCTLDIPYNANYAYLNIMFIG